MMKPVSNEGFTLVETLVAIAILMIAIAGPLYAIYQAIQSTYIARDQLIATSLAQEGTEYVRNHRDSNYLYNVANPATPVGWLNGLAPCQVAGQSCMVDVTANYSTAPVTCSGACSPLKLSASNLYAYSGTTTRFTRSVQITTVSASEVVVTSTVTWITTRVPHSITVTEHLYNWLNLL